MNPLPQPLSDASTGGGNPMKIAAWAYWACAPALYVPSWAPWIRLVTTLVVIVVLVALLRLTPAHLALG